ncbi:hypothetical protein [Limnofasciculus baicalensis]|uniref:Uncharacterized protein n=1 Tax=Limnofasciculus baicalensis BBK-W-15 TaxID=2699891 RepID=A0AAE3KMZ4_9CYAN|nr:hypothetical protein [Limnofasciculus baicalensis]MCP2729764.1 hypothetical protein [Limnofasciculus baicalensis BBK-W-15]
MDETWIIFEAEPNQPGWETRLNPMGGLTDILTEHRDFSSKGKIPKIGYRFPVFLRIESAAKPGNIGSTHYRQGDWVVTRIEHYPAGSPDCSVREIAVCYCQFDPIEAQLVQLEEPKVSLDSFGGDKESYNRWLNSKTGKALTT